MRLLALFKDQLYFDKETGLLAKGERVLKDEGKDVVEEMLFSGYKDVDGVKMAMRVVSRRVGKVHADPLIRSVFENVGNVELCMVAPTGSSIRRIGFELGTKQ